MPPARFTRREKMPNNSVGKNELAANPKANATVLAIKADGGLMQNHTATSNAEKEAARAQPASCRSVIVGMIFFTKSWAIEVESTSNNPAAVESAAAMQLP